MRVRVRARGGGLCVPRFPALSHPAGLHFSPLLLSPSPSSLQGIPPLSFSLPLKSHAFPGTPSWAHAPKVLSDDRCSDFQDSCSVFLQLGGLSLSVRI